MNDTKKANCQPRAQLILLPTRPAHEARDVDDPPLVGALAYLRTALVVGLHGEDQAAAVQRMVQAQIIPTTVEAALLELVHEAGTSRFKALLPIIK